MCATRGDCQTEGCLLSPSTLGNGIAPSSTQLWDRRGVKELLMSCVLVSFQMGYLAQMSLFVSYL